ncbi:MAG: DEAD/DEAH box helicase [Methanoregulaceae archaeon]|nr:DEAD/DEAH box helicase [Methanoregulaceae archaeon]
MSADNRIDDLIAAIRRDKRFSPCLAHHNIRERTAAQFGALSRPLPAGISRYLEEKNVRLYSHQADTVEAVRSGEHSVLCTPTASGKTFAFLIPVFERLDASPDATALFLYPTKALANDQLGVCKAMESGTRIPGYPAVYDGDTPNEKRSGIRGRSRIVLSNPYELHYILPWHHLWARFFRNLQVVVIDEAHRYRGITGSHLAFLVRRLRRVCEHYGSNPTFILSSATLANPLEFASRLTGHTFRLISGDGAPHGRRHFILYNPFPDGAEVRSAHSETGALLLACIRAEMQTLCFTGSRKSAELITLWSRDGLIRAARDPGLVSAYRAGYLPEERRGIEERFKSGSFRGVVSTNALELGIDIGSLDTVIISGYPGSIMSVWQQAGRAGRGTGDSLAMLIAFPNPLDQYFMHHPGSFFGAPHEHAIVDLENPYVLSGQVLCASAELPIDLERDAGYFGDTLPAVIEAHAGEHLMAETRKGWIYAGRRRPSEITGFGAASGEGFRILCGKETIETLDRAQAFREAHQGAVLLHQGEKYLVSTMDLTQHIVRVSPTDVDYYTKPLKSVNVRILDEQRQRSACGTSVVFGEVEVTETYTAYKVIHGDTTIGIEPLDLPPLTFRTKAIWFGLPPGAAEHTTMAGLDLAGGLHALEHAVIAMMPFEVMCDRWDLGGLSTPAFGETGSPTVIVYDGYEGGIGLTENAYSLFEEIVLVTKDMVSGCGCEKGCPACVYSPKCGNDNQPLDKVAALMLLSDMVGGEGARDTRRDGGRADGLVGQTCNTGLSPDEPVSG